MGPFNRIIKSEEQNHPLQSRNLVDYVKSEMHIGSEFIEIILRKKGCLLFFV